MSDPVSDVDDIAVLKRSKITALAAVTRCRNSLVQLMLNDDNLHHVKTELDEYDGLFLLYQKAHGVFHDSLLSEDDQDKETKRYCEHENNIRHFRRQATEWIIEAERHLSDGMERLSATQSRHTGSTRSSRKSHASSTQSARAREKAKIAALLVEREFQPKKQAIQAEEQKLQLDLEIGKARAREEVYAAEIHRESHSNSIQVTNRSDNTNVKTVIPNVDNSITNVDINENVVNNVNDPLSNAPHSVHTIYHDFTELPEVTTNYVPLKSSAGDKLQAHAMHSQKSAQAGLPQQYVPMLSPTARIYHPKSHHQTEYPVPPLQDYQDSLQQLVSAMTLPQPEVPKFRGDPMEFHTFIMAFDARIVSRTASHSDQLYYLDQHLVGEAKDLVGGCLHMDPSSGYLEARSLLQKEYGDPYKIATAYINKVLTWPNIKHDDSTALRKFSIFLVRCLKAMRNIANMDVLNHLPNLQAIISKLPGYLQNKWREHVNKLRRNDQRMANFNDLTCFVEYASESANDPVFSKSALNKCTHSSAPHSGNVISKGRQENRFKSSSFAVAINSSPSSRDSHAASKVPYKGLCYYCRKPHDIDECPDFQKISIDDRRSFIIDKKMCFACYGLNHISKGCLRKRTCKVCGKQHPTSLHVNDFQLIHRKTENQSPTISSMPSNSKSHDNVQTYTCGVSNVDNQVILHAIIPVQVRQRHKDTTVITYAFYDNGSSGCFLTNDLQSQLNADGHDTTLSLHTMQGQSTIQSTVVNGLIVSGINGENPIELPRCFTKDEIPINHSQIPKRDVLSRWTHLHEAMHEMPAYLPDTPIGLLIGNNCVKAHEPSKVIPSSGNGPFAALYPHGWTINGPFQINNVEDGTSQVTYCNRINVQEVKFCETFTPKSILRIFDTDFNDLYTDNIPGKLGLSQEDIIFMKKVEVGIIYHDGHYVLPLPFRESNIHMPNNREQAIKRAHWQRKKLSSNYQYYNDYVTFINKILTSGYAEKIPIDQLNTEVGKVWYLPHHGIYHPTKPNKLRVVFDCSAKFDGTALNDHLLQGPDLTNSLVGVLTRFRQEPVAFMGDIEAMFHQVRVATHHHNFLRFLWWPNGDLSRDLEEYRMVAHLFGASSSPSIANFALRKTADEAEVNFGSEVADTIRNNFYVDDCLKAMKSEDDAIQLIQDLRTACKQRGFRITKFSSNRPNVLDSIPSEECSKEIQTRSFDYDDLPSERALGVHWRLAEDTYGFSIKIKNKPSTRRGILSIMSSVYDPLGFVAPFILYAKKILQDLCREQNLEWDDPVPEEYLVRWNNWLDELPQLENVHVVRCIKPLNYGNVISCQLHVFSDASNMGYGAVAYLRLVDHHNKIHCTFLMGKARLAPLKITTIPRLELTAATVAVRIGHLLQKELDLKLDKIVYHTDSTTVLHYIFNEKKRFPIFVANRVQFIRDYSSTNQWRYIDTNENPADYASRGMNIHQITQNQTWLNGPNFLWQPETSWPEQPILSKDYHTDMDFITTSAVITIDEAVSTVSILIQHYSDWFQLKKAVAIYLKLFQFLHRRTEHCTTQEMDYSISVTDIADSENAILRYVQKQFFPRETDALSSHSTNEGRNDCAQHIPKSSTIYKLDPFLSNGLLRVGGRLSKANIPDEMKFPVLLPHKCHVTTLII